MKSIILIALFSFGVAQAADICTNTDGSIVYDNATTLGNSTVYSNPGFMVAGKRAGIRYNRDYPRNSAIAFCKAIAHSSGTVSSIKTSEKDQLVAYFSSDGRLSEVAPGRSYVIQMVTCYK